jgi:hypothetical protein
MRKIIVITGAIVFVGASLASASVVDARAAEETYNTFGETGGSISNFVQFPTYKEERAVRVRIDDVSERDVAAQLSQDPDRDKKWTVIATICGETSKAVRITGGRPIRVRFIEDVCSDSGIPAWVTGTVTATFTS